MVLPGDYLGFHAHRTRPGRNYPGSSPMWCEGSLNAILRFQGTYANEYSLFQQQAILEAIQESGCPLTDIECICKNTEFVSELVGLIPQLCSQEDSAVTAEGAQGICMAYGVELSLPDLSGTPNSTSITTAASGTSETNTPTPATSSAIVSTQSTVSDSGSTSAPASSTIPSSSPTEAVETSVESSAAAETSNRAVANTVGLSSLVGVVLLGLTAVL
ncbi:hypothetical protein LTR84_002438 [Exophiala bonariae]|uniref:CFEM domain-containing protein n=1 Tax=Exophiala bonariae TaxID=1690606 RepID=A0AAV9N9H9_9EURO|nr:hypothetical protein LTR84_002438 [Exophiala bonariae]